MDVLFQCTTAFIACIGFAFVFRVHHHYRFAIFGALGGALGWMIYRCTGCLNNNIISYFIAMCSVAFYGEIMARIYKAPATIFIIIGCFPLVPGKGIYETMLHIVDGNNDMFIDSLLNTFAISLTLALSILLISTLFKINKRLKEMKAK